MQKTGTSTVYFKKFSRTIIYLLLALLLLFGTISEKIWAEDGAEEAVVILSDETEGVTDEDSVYSIQNQKKVKRRLCKDVMSSH